MAVMAQTFYQVGSNLSRCWRRPAEIAAPLFAEAKSTKIVLDNLMMNNASYPCRIRLVRAGLSRARRARARMRRQRLLMFRLARSN